MSTAPNEGRTPDPATEGTDREATIYERIGGAEGVERLVSAFYARVLNDPQLEPIFARANVERLLSMQRTFFAAALGGPVTYRGRSMAHAHHGRGITRTHFALFVEHLFGTLEGFDLTEADAREIVSRVNTYADEVIGGHGASG